MITYDDLSYTYTAPFVTYDGEVITADPPVYVIRFAVHTADDALAVSAKRAYRIDIATKPDSHAIHTGQEAGFVTSRSSQCIITSSKSIANIYSLKE